MTIFFRNLLKRRILLSPSPLSTPYNFGNLATTFAVVVSTIHHVLLFLLLLILAQFPFRILLLFQL